MALKELAILLTARNSASGPVKTLTRDVSTLDRVAGRAGKGLGTLAGNVKKIAAIGIGVGAGLGIKAIADGLNSLQARENVIAATEAAIKATGGAARVSATDIRQWAEEIEGATSALVDDKAIQAAENNLLRFTAVGHDVFKRTITDAVDLGAAMKTGPEAASKLLGKALSDPVKAMGALKKAGVVLTAEESDRVKQLVKGNQVQAAQIVLLEAVEKRYKGAAAASGGPYARAMAKLRDTWEDGTMALSEGLLPLITKLADKLQQGVANPRVMAQIRGIGQGLADGFERVLGAADKIPWGSIGDAMKLASQGAKAAFDLFTGLPPWVQTAVVTGWGLNKLTGGALSGIIGEIGKGLVKGVLGMNAGVVNIKAAVVNGGASAPGSQVNPLVPTAAAGGILEFLGVSSAGAAVGVIAAGVLGGVLQNAGTISGIMAMQDKIDALRASAAGPGSLPQSLRADGGGAGSALPFTGSSRGAGAAQTIVSPIVAKLNVLHGDFIAQRSLLKAGSQSEKAAAATALAKDVLKGAGSVTTTKDLIDQLKAARLTVTDPAARKAIDAALAKVERKLPGREWIDAQKKAARDVATSNRSAGEKLRMIEAIQRDLLSHGDTAAAQIVAGLLAVQGAVNGLRGFGTAGDSGRGTSSDNRPPVWHDTPDSGQNRGRDLNVFVKTTVSPRQIDVGLNRFHRVNPSRSVTID